MALRDEDFRIVDVNPAFVAQTGFSREEALGKDYVLGGTVEPDAAILARHRRALAGAPAVVETVRVRKDGTQIDVELRCIPIQHQGRPHVLYVARDISARKRAEEALRASEEQYRSIFNAAQDSDGAARCRVPRGRRQRRVPRRHPDTRARRCSGATACSATTPPEIDRLLKSRHAGVLAGEPMVVETQRTREDGRRFDLELRGVPVQYRGRPHVLYIGRDISERKRAEEALRVSEEQYRSIFNASQDTMVLRDADFRVVDVNDAYVAVTGFSREEALGQDRRARQRPARVRAVPAGAASPGARRRDDGARDRARAQGRPARAARAARRAGAAPGQAARALHRPRHRRAQARRGGAARERGAVPRDLQCLRRRHDPARRRFPRGRRQPGLRAP